MRQSLRVRLVSSVALCALLVSTSARTEEKTAVVNIPAGITSAALQELIHQTRENVLFTPEMIRGLKSREVRGRYTTEQAVRELLIGTPLEVVRDPVGALIIRQKISQNIAPAPRASILAAPALPQIAAAAAPSVPAAMVVAAQIETPPVEQVLVTGSLIHGAVAVGAPVASLGDADFRETGALTISDVLRSVPSVIVLASSSVTNGGNNLERGTGVDIHGLATRSPRTLMLIDGMRYPAQGHGACAYDPSIIPALALDRVDVLADGASATYGSDAVAGVINVVLKRGYDGAVSQFRIGSAQDGGRRLQATQLFGRTWDGGDVTVSYEWYDETPIPARKRSGFTYDYTPWGLDDRTPLTSSLPGTVSTGAPTANTGTGCTNCYSVPSGQNGVGLTWATLLASKGVVNEVNPYLTADATAAQQRNGATITFDQKITNGIRFFGEAFYSNRRSQITFPPTITTSKNNSFTAAVPTSNPYYPTGAPAGLRVSYNIAYELAPITSTSEISQRYAGGFDLDLPNQWTGRLLYSVNEEKNFANQGGAVNLNNLSAALGNTVAAVAASGNSPGQSAFTKPANVPYLNLFCDPTEFACNSQTTLDYITGYRIYDVRYLVHEYGANFDGPVVSVPGGDIRAAIGANYVTHNFIYYDRENYNAPSTALGVNIPDPESRNVWAVFGQINVPLFEAQNAIPLFQKLELELSYRYDHYSDFGGTTNPKIALNWSPIESLVFRGTWGTSFRAPSFTESTATSGVTIQALNVAAGASSNSTPACVKVGGTPVAGSVAALLNPSCSAALQYPGGIAISGGAGGAAFLRGGNGVLAPEKARNFGFGAEYAPTGMLSGLDVQATYFNVKIDGLLQLFQLTTGAGLNDPTTAFTIILPSDPNFSNYVNQLIRSPTSQVSPSFASAITFINDASFRNAGTQKLDGIDFNASYDWDMGDFGAWNTGVTGTYFLHKSTTFVPGTTPVDSYNVGGQTQEVRFRYRGRLGWSDDSWSVTGFVNYQSHYYNTQPLPPAASLALFPNYSNLQPSFYTFDLSLGYDLGNRPANDYLKNINFQLVATNVTNRLAPFMYRVNTTGGNPAAFDINLSPVGRMLTFIVTKSW